MLLQLSILIYLYILMFSSILSSIHLYSLSNVYYLHPKLKLSFFYSKIDPSFPKIHLTSFLLLVFVSLISQHLVSQSLQVYQIIHSILEYNDLFLLHFVVSFWLYVLLWSFSPLSLAILSDSFWKIYSFSHVTTPLLIDLSISLLEDLLLLKFGMKIICSAELSDLNSINSTNFHLFFG